MQERFAIRTVIFNEGHGNQTVRTVVVTGRLAAAVAVEKIGKLSDQGWHRMKRFLEGGAMSKTGNITFETDETVSIGDGRMQANLAMILIVDEVS